MTDTSTPYWIGPDHGFVAVMPDDYAGACLTYGHKFELRTRMNRLGSTIITET